MRRQMDVLLSFRLSAALKARLDAYVEKRKQGPSGSRIERGEAIRLAIRLMLAKDKNPPHGVPLTKKGVARKAAS